MAYARLRLLAPRLLVLVVASGMLLMHGFEAVSPEILLTHAQHEADTANATATVAGICLFVTALAVTAVNNPRAATTTGPVEPCTRRWTTRRSSGWKPPRRSIHQLCVMRV
ncbi:MAG TPA: hypothetical protein VMS74_08660 [Acidimicrobiia bacterium]|nr:hypothetical protein [Acidimicrobiia bacterium]